MRYKVETDDREEKTTLTIIQKKKWFLFGGAVYFATRSNNV